MIPPALAQYKQFVIYREDKKPVNPYTGRLADPTDPADWSDASTALDAVQKYGALGVGFVFAKTDPFFFLDIDHAIADGQASTLATQLCGLFTGCFIEISLSGTGFHVIGTGFEPHNRVKNKLAGIEFYTEAHYCALTGLSAIGDASFQPRQDILKWLVDSYFTGPAVENPDPEWTTGPCEGYGGPEDDEQLIEKMLSARGSAAAAFGARVSLKELWEGNIEKIAASFPPKPGRPGDFDHSLADASMCQHLAFWTGKNCERMDRLFRRSALYRQKWERENYREPTILLAVSRCTAVYGAKPTKPEATPTGEGHVGLREGYQLLSIPQQIEYFTGCVYIRGPHKIFTPDGGLLGPDQFRATYGGYAFVTDMTGEKTFKSAWEAFTESQGYKFPKVHDACFRPELQPGEIVEEEGRKLINTYVPIPTRRVAGDPAPFLEHIARLLPAEIDRQIILSYMAALVQYPGIKFQWMPLIQGVEGNGKTLFTACLEHAVGSRYSHRPNAADISNKFNAWLLNKLFIGIEEIYVAEHQEALDALKPLITNDRIDIQAKGLNQATADNRANFFGTSNHRDAVRKTTSDRRYCVFYTAQQEPSDIAKSGMSGDYFPHLYQWLRADGYAIVNNYLREFVIADALNPATHCHRAPVTSTTEEAISSSLGRIEQEIMEAVEQGRTGFAGGWISSLALDQLIVECRSRISPSKRREILRGLGYDYHPGLNDGRVNNPILDSGRMGKPRLYIKVGHIAANLRNGPDIVRHYLEAQNGVGVGAAFGLTASSPKY